MSTEKPERSDKEAFDLTWRIDAMLEGHSMDDIADALAFLSGKWICSCPPEMREMAIKDFVQRLAGALNAYDRVDKYVH